MTDPYEYLLNKLDVTLEFTPNESLCPLYIKLETGKKIISIIPINWTKKDIFKYYRNLYLNEYYRQYDEELDFFCQLLRQFPAELESKEHVDILLAVNGLIKKD